MNAATFFTNINSLCLIESCEIKQVGCVKTYTGKKLKFDTTAPFELKAVNGIIAGWKETVCVICRNSKQTIKMDKQVIVQNHPSCKGSLTEKANLNKQISLEYTDSKTDQIINKNGWKDFFSVSSDP